MLIRLLNQVLGRGTPDAQALAQQLTALQAELTQLRSAVAEREKNLLKHQIAAKWELIHRLNAAQPEADSLTCALCGHTAPLDAFATFDTECIFGGGHLHRHQCPECDVIFGSQLMLALDAAALSREYEWHYQVFTEGDSTEQEIRAFHALQPRRDGTYLNWGAGAWSSSVARLREDGWNIVGYEPHDSAAVPGMVRSWAELSQMQFDGILSNNLLEHLRQPVADLKTMASLLKPGGLMSHATPCFEYRFEFTRFHLFFFLGRSRRWLVEQAGLEWVDYQTEGDFMNLVVRKP